MQNAAAAMLSMLTAYCLSYILISRPKSVMNICKLPGRERDLGTYEVLVAGMEGPELPPREKKKKENGKINTTSGPDQWMASFLADLDFLVWSHNMIHPIRSVS